MVEGEVAAKNAELVETPATSYSLPLAKQAREGAQTGAGT